jgi:glycosyltransferase involved in cell wall biosynthesis
VRELRPGRFDLVHIHWASYGILGLVSKIPFVVECHGSDVRHRLRHPASRALLAPILRRAAVVHCITPDLLPIVQSVRADARFFPGPVDTAHFAPLGEPASESRPWTVLLFTRLDPEKGPEVAITGILSFARRHPEVRVLLLDWGLLKESLKRRYSGRFTFLAPVPREQVRELLSSADVVVGQLSLGILSFCELQAMSCAKPVICSFRYAQAYIDPPPLLQAATPEEVDAQLEYVFQNQTLGLTLGQQAREWVKQNHDHHLLTEKLEKVYQEIITNGI